MPNDFLEYLDAVRKSISAIFLQDLEYCNNDKNMTATEAQVKAKEHNIDYIA